MQAPVEEAQGSPSRPVQGATRNGGVQLVAPAAVREIDVDPEVPLKDLWLPPSRCGQPYRSALLVVRLRGDLIGTVPVAVDPEGRVPHERLAQALLSRFESELLRVLAGHWFPTHEALDGGSSATAEPRPRARSISVVVTTCSNPAPLERCLRSVLACDYHDLEVIVVENRPGSGATRRLVSERFGRDMRVRYAEEHRRGLSFARNAGLTLAVGELVAFIDDDVVVDPAWLGRCAEAFNRAGDVACVTGLILPLELETHGQVLLEQFAGFAKGFAPRTYRLVEERAADPLFPYTPGVVGSGANTVLHAEVARELGGFDTTLGAGTPAAGGEDLDMYLRVLREGYAVAYEPSALVRHEHPDGEASIRRQVHRYGVGLGALVTKQLIVGPGRLELLRAVPAGVRYARDPDSRKNAGKQAGYPRRLDWLERVGMAAGPVAYALSAARRGLQDLRSESAADILGVDRVIIGTRAVEVVTFRDREAGRVPGAKRRVPRATADGALLATAAVACLAAPLLVALAPPAALRLPAGLALLCLAPGAALTTIMRGAVEPGLALAVSLAVTALLAQAMIWLGAWWPEPMLYALAVACFPVLIAGLAVRGPPGGRIPEISQSTRAHAAVVGGALVIWILSLPVVDLAEIDGFGLLSALPPTYFLAVALLLGGFLAAVGRAPVDPRLLALYVVALVVVLHGTTPLLYDEPRYTWTFAHLGVIDLIAEEGDVDRSIDIYNNWPGFFALNAFLSTVAGVGAETYAGWAQVFFNLLAVAALRFALRGVTDDQRLLWTASLLFVLGNWVGQDYLAPQAFGFVLSLVVLGLCLRCAPPPPPPRSRLDRWWRGVLGRWRADAFPGPAAAGAAPLSPRAALISGGACYLAVVVSHQLSPIMLLLGVTALSLVTRRIPLWVPVAMALVEAAWLLSTWSYLSDRFDLLNPDLGASRVPRGYSVGDGLPGLTTVTITTRAAVVLVVALAVVGLVRRLRAGHLDLAIVSLALAPLLVFGVQSYGGEGRFRVYLFALPWLSFLAAAACAPAPGSRLSSGLRQWRLAVAGAALCTCLLVAYFGLELVNRVTRDDVAASTWFERRAPSGSLLVTATPNFPTRLSARYPVVYDRGYTASPTLSDETALRGRRLGPADLPRLQRTLEGYGVQNVFLMLTPSQKRFARLYGVFPPGSLSTLDRALRASPSFRLVWAQGRSTLFAYQPRRGRG
jgi:GT2 family glycosyltransferase